MILLFFVFVDVHVAQISAIFAKAQCGFSHRMHKAVTACCWPVVGRMHAMLPWWEHL